MKKSEFKEISVSEDVKKELHEMAERIHEICQQNNIPYIFYFIDERREAGDSVIANKHRGCYANYDSGAWDSSLTAASLLAQIDEVSEDVIISLACMDELQDDPAENKSVH
ncbi:hypothetical protein NAK90_005735 [Salmonella enterica]|nr:hypothetical protein [Salmonella enterica subsp. enterica serovar Muenchen]EBX4460997.1 hypothetical protein [Salmonella enterica subsp. enterica serovar Muenchen]EBY3556344.1 hypothetical protein [Salmonella enterica subsp. enterica serovar Muenchen]EJG7682111.1 hypothetical protein [Salmonella enterica]HAF2714252.1 hypothetical protein [Salmonella enterica]